MCHGMGETILDLKRRVYQLTSDFSGAATGAMIALNTPPLTDETLALVRECREVGRDYRGALDELLGALRRSQDADRGEVERIERLRELLERELSLIASHPALPVVAQDLAVPREK